MDNALKNWWKTGSLGSVDTNVGLDDKALVKFAVTVVVAFLIIYVSYKIISAKTQTKKAK